MSPRPVIEATSSYLNQPLRSEEEARRSREANAEARKERESKGKS